MSVFKLSNNDEEIKLHMEAYIDHANSLEGFYSDYNFHYYDSSWEEGWIEFIHTATAYDMNRYGNTVIPLWRIRMAMVFPMASKISIIMVCVMRVRPAHTSWTQTAMV